VANVSFSGGEKTKAFFKNAGKGGVKAVDVGFFSTAKYPDGTPVASVAAWNEFGTLDIPERPAIRAANKINERVILRILKDGVDSKIMTVSKQLAGKVGVSQQNAVKKSMRDLRRPPNTPETIAAKGGRSNPLVNTGTLIKSVTFKVIK
jgi:hypothetical protein